MSAQKLPKKLPAQAIVASEPPLERGDLKSYQIGFGVSLLLTLLAYMSVVHHLLSRRWLIGLVAVLAISQFFVQLIYFLHLGKETKPRWKLLVFGFMMMVVILVVFGSLWIMTNLNYHMTPQQMNQYMQNQDGL